MLVVAMLSAGAATTPMRVAVLGFVFLFGLAGIMAEEQAVWQVRVPVEAQGRVFALRRAITWASLPVSYALAGPLADSRLHARDVAGRRARVAGSARYGHRPGPRHRAAVRCAAGSRKARSCLPERRICKLKRLDALT